MTNMFDHDSQYVRTLSLTAHLMTNMRAMNNHKQEDLRGLTICLCPREEERSFINFKRLKELFFSHGDLSHKSTSL